MKHSRNVALAAALSLLALTPAFAADNLIGKMNDTGSTPFASRAYDIGADASGRRIYVPAHALVDALGAPLLTPSNPGVFTLSGVVPLPAGASTAAAQATANAALASIATNTTGGATAAAQATGNASLSSIDGKLTGAATAAAQATGNASLSSIDGKLTGAATAAAQATGNASAAATAAAVGTPADAAWDGAAANASHTSVLKALWSKLSGLLSVDTVVKASSTSRSAIVPVAGASAAVTAGGTGQAVGDVLTLVGGTCTVQPKFTVATVASGVAATVTLSTPGSCTVLPTAPVATTSTGTGTGATLTPAYVSIPTQIMAANVNRRGYRIQPQGSIAYRGTTVDQNSMKLPADGLYETLPQHVGTGAISVISAGVTPLPVFAEEF
ncbi:hypothetical protein [Methylobacterium sp. E-041]|uniref:hypothetical protein n=1 Tax=Methylobacterium sp. E-041 TaxID=2836573 RepID=UPI002443D7A7|nr:hypothetical protein [Methylobacterium sp. E-041]